MRYLQSTVLAFIGACVATCACADDLRVVQLQQDVRDLQREVLQQTRRIETLEQQLAQTRTGAGSRLLVPQARRVSMHRRCG